eukprot:COSAG02_NODE_617_length_19476_cov_158.404913_15_plen_535_part_00
MESRHEVGVQLAGSINSTVADSRIETSIARCMSIISEFIARLVGAVIGCPGLVPGIIMCGVTVLCIGVSCPNVDKAQQHLGQGDEQDHIWNTTMSVCVGNSYKPDLRLMSNFAGAIFFPGIVFTLPSVRRVMRDGYLEQLGADQLKVVSQLPSVLFAPVSSDAMHAQIEHAVPNARFSRGFSRGSREGSRERLLGMTPTTSETATVASTSATLRTVANLCGVCISWLAYMCFVCVLPVSGLCLEISIRIGDNTKDTLRDGLHLDQYPWVANQAMQMPVFVTAVPLAIFWLMTLLTAASFVTREVVSLTRIVKTADLASESWTVVEKKAARVATELLPTLANGWEDAIVATCITCWAVAFRTVANILRNVHSTSNCGTECWKDSKVLGHVIGATAAAATPALVLWKCAGITTYCGKLLRVLNEKRAELLSDDAHVKIEKVEAILQNSNSKQGAGFMVFGTVVNQQFLRKQLFKLATLSLTGMTTFLATTQQETQQEGNHRCSASKEQASIVRAVFANESCIYDQTIAEILQGAQH